MFDITAYTLPDSQFFWPLVPAEPSRRWMDTTGGFAYRCLPMTMANSLGWYVLSPATFSATWNGSDAPHTSVMFEWGDAGPAPGISCHFGFGILTFHIPYLFRTTEPFGLIARGVPNYFKRHIVPLEGFVETWWVPFTFTMNWKFLYPHAPVLFEKGDPICFIQPYSPVVVSSSTPVIRPLADNSDLSRDYDKWLRSRQAFNHDPTRKPEEWQKDYHRGCDLARLRAPIFAPPNPENTDAAISPS